MMMNQRQKAAVRLALAERRAQIRSLLADLRVTPIVIAHSWYYELQVVNRLMMKAEFKSVDMPIWRFIQQYAIRQIRLEAAKRPEVREYYAAMFE